MTNAYDPPCVLDETEAANGNDSLLTGCGCIAFPFAGALFGFFGFFATAYLIENFFPLPNGTPVLSHGQQAMLFTLPMCTLIGFGIGISLSFAIARQFAISILAIALFSILVTYINNRLWDDQVRRYGCDYSEMVLYYPPLILVGMAIELAAVIAILGVRRAVHDHGRTT